MLNEVSVFIVLSAVVKQLTHFPEGPSPILKPGLRLDPQPGFSFPRLRTSEEKPLSLVRTPLAELAKRTPFQAWSRQPALRRFHGCEVGSLVPARMIQGVPTMGGIFPPLEKTHS